MNRFGRSVPVLLCTGALAALGVYADAGSGAQEPARAGSGAAADVPLKDAKLNIEHNATDKDTGLSGVHRQRGLAAARSARAQRRRAGIRGPREPWPSSG